MMAQQAPATVGVVLGNEAAAHGEGCVVHARGRRVVDHDGAGGAAASGPDVFPAVVDQPLRSKVSEGS